MSLSKFESEVKFIPQPNVYVYSRFADLSNLGTIKERLADPEVQERIGQQVPADKVEELKKYVEAMTFDTDSIQIASPLGNISLRIVDVTNRSVSNWHPKELPFNSMSGFSSYPMEKLKRKCV
ncbi:MAG: hypothetical protein ACLS29_02450 [Prevotellamassilia sp.]